MNARITLAAGLAAALLLHCTQADARRAPAEPAIITCNQQGCSDLAGAAAQPSQQAVADQRPGRRARTARHATGRPAGPAVAGAGVVRSGKTGATTTVASRNVAAFQAYIDDLEQNYGAAVHFMGGYRRGPCSVRSEHPCGNALDVCQISRGKVAHGQPARRGRWPDCHLPDRATLIAVASRHGLFEGGAWCDSDMGHVQSVVTAGRCWGNLYAAVGKFKRREALAQ